MTSSTSINSIVDSVVSDLETASTTLGLGATPKVYERDEHPASALSRGDIPCAYVIPLLEGGDTIGLHIDDLPHKHDFAITVTAYYMGNDTTVSQLATDLRTTRNYGYAFVDIYKTKTRGAYFTGGGWVKSFKLDVGYWISGGGQVVHFWIVKMNVTTYTS